MNDRLSKEGREMLTDSETMSTEELATKYNLNPRSVKAKLRRLDNMPDVEPKDILKLNRKRVLVIAEDDRGYEERIDLRIEQVSPSGEYLCVSKKLYSEEEEDENRWLHGWKHYTYIHFILEILGDLKPEKNEEIEEIEEA